MKFLSFVLAMLTFSVCSWADVLTADDWVEQGKSELIQNMNVTTAYTCFNNALAINPDHEKANFWKGVVLASQNAELTATLKNLKLLDTDGLPMIWDAEDGFNYNPQAKVDNIIMDDTAAAYTGTWETQESGSDYGSGYRFHAAGTGANKATWNIAIQVPGYYEIHVWAPNVGTTAGFKYEINTGYNVQYKTFYPQGVTGQWKYIGEYDLNASGASITLTDESTGPVAADGIKLVFKGVIRDDADRPGFSTSGGGWKTQNIGFGGTSTYHDAGAGDSATWTPSVPETGKYQVYAYINQVQGSSSNTRYTITPSGMPSKTVYIDQSAYSQEWVCLGVFELASGMANMITVLSAADGKVTADAVKIVPCKPFPDMTEGQDILLGLVDTQVSGAELELALACIAKVTSQDFSDTVTMPDSISYVIDQGEVKAAEAALYMAKAFIYVNAAYDMNNLDVQAGIFLTDPISFFTETYPDALKPLPQAGTRLLAAKTSLEKGMEKYNAASAFIRARSDTDGLNHLIRFYAAQPPAYDPLIYPSYGDWEREMADWQEEKDMGLAVEAFARGYMDDVYANLTDHVANPYVEFLLPELSEEIFPQELGINVKVDLWEFFTDPKDIRSFGENFMSGDIIRDDFSDPTFGGVLPGFTPRDWNYLMQYGPQIDENISVIWSEETPVVSIKWDRVAPAQRDAFLRYDIYRSETADVTLSSELVASISDPDVITYTDTGVSGGTDAYYYRVYTYFDFSQAPGPAAAAGAGDTASTYSAIGKAVLKLYVDQAYAGYEETGTRQCPYADMREAIWSLTSDGTKICVARGTYSGSIYVWQKPSVILEGGYAPEDWTRDIINNETIITGQNSSWSVLSVSYTNNAVVDGFTLRDGMADEYGGGPGLYLYMATVTVKNCRMVNNGGNGIYTDCANAVLSNNCIVDNGREGVYVYGSSSNIVAINNTIVNNGGNGGIYYYSAGSMEIANNIIISNNKGWGKRGIYGQTGVPANVWNNDCYDNTNGNYYNCGTSAGQNGNISADPGFAASGADGYYLSQAASGQATQSPCVDTGMGTALDTGLYLSYTRTDKALDTGAADMGFHYTTGKTGVMDELIGDFGDGAGVWARYFNGEWSQIVPVTTENIVPADVDGDRKQELVMDFGQAYGLYICDPATSSWKQLTAADPLLAVKGDVDGNGKDDIICDFGTNIGIWVYYNDATWAPLVPASAEFLAAGDINKDGKDEIIGDFGAGNGIWAHFADGDRWAQVAQVGARSITAGDIDGDKLDELVIDFGSAYGIWVYRDNAFTGQLCQVTGDNIVAADIDNDKKDEIIVDFGSETGIWAYYASTAGWGPIVKEHSLKMCSGKLDQRPEKDLAAYFGSSIGLWARYGTGAWAFMTGTEPERITAGNIK